ncbi:MAG: T9SS type A sorting domain-containing protein, partial [Chitinophagales bacterium]
DLGAPGTAIYTVKPNDQFGVSSGTSMAAPVVTGAASLFYAAACDSFFLKPVDQALIIKQFILEGAEWLPGLIGKTKSNGRLNLFKSLELFLSDQCVSCLETNVLKSEITCPDDNDGTVNIQITQGQAPYTFQWNDVFSDSLRYGIKNGQYFITISDTNNCQKVIQLAFQNPDSLLLNLSSTPELNNEMDGTASVEVLGGRPPYSYFWSNGDTLDSLSNLSSGWYYLSLRDQAGAGCLITDSVFVERNIVDGVASEFESISVCPNPASDRIRIEFSALAQIQLLDLSGNILQRHPVKDKKQLEISRAQLPPGIYFLKLTNATGQQAYHKIIFL